MCTVLQCFTLHGACKCAHLLQAPPFWRPTCAARRSHTQTDLGPLLGPRAPLSSAQSSGRRASAAGAREHGSPARARLTACAHHSCGRLLALSAESAESAEFALCNLQSPQCPQSPRDRRHCHPQSIAVHALIALIAVHALIAELQPILRLSASTWFARAPARFHLLGPRYPSCGWCMKLGVPGLTSVVVAT